MQLGVRVLPQRGRGLTPRVRGTYDEGAGGTYDAGAEGLTTEVRKVRGAVGLINRRRLRVRVLVATSTAWWPMPVAVSSSAEDQRTAQTSSSRSMNQPERPEIPTTT